MSRISQFEPQLAALLPATHAILESANVTVHPKVSLITLHGSRGLAGGYRPDSDIDLSLMVDTPPDLVPAELGSALRDILEVTLSNWRSKVEADLAVVFDLRNCGLKCFERTAWDDRLCPGGVDCFGLFKIQKGFHGLAAHAGVQVRRMYPCLRIWRRR